MFAKKLIVAGEWALVSGPMGLEITKNGEMVTVGGKLEILHLAESNLVPSDDFSAEVLNVKNKSHADLAAMYKKFITMFDKI